MVGLALSTAMVFLVMAAQELDGFGNLFVGRIWQGKIVFLAVLVPLLYVLQAYASSPRGASSSSSPPPARQAWGSTSTAATLVPLLAVGCLAPLPCAPSARPRSESPPLPRTRWEQSSSRPPRSRRPARTWSVTSSRTRSPGSSWAAAMAFIAVAAALVGPLLIASRRAALMAGSTVLLVAILYAPPVPPFVWELTGIGRVLWRGVWVVPVAVLLGAVVTAVGASRSVAALERGARGAGVHSARRLGKPRLGRRECEVHAVLRPARHRSDGKPDPRPRRAGRRRPGPATGGPDASDHVRRGDDRLSEGLLHPRAGGRARRPRRGTPPAPVTARARARQERRGRTEHADRGRGLAGPPGRRRRHRLCRAPDARPDPGVPANGFTQEFRAAGLRCLRAEA